MESQSPAVSVVTIVKGDLRGLQRTRSSLAQQLFKDWEHVIVAGRHDSSLALAKSYSSETTTVCIQPGLGIYSAMNLGLRNSTGTYVVFINAGDELADGHSLSTAFLSLTKNYPSWAVFGGLFSRFGKLIEIVPHPDPTTDLISIGKANISHPSVYYRRDFLLMLGGYREDFQIAGDLHLNLRASLHDRPTVTPTPVSIFYHGGVSTTRPMASILESHQARLRVFGHQPKLLLKLWIILLIQLSRYQIRKILDKRSSFLDERWRRTSIPTVLD